jgi:Flp pilus assembly protein TadG
MRAITAAGARQGVKRWIADRGGAASVEFALLLPLLVTLVVGIIDYAQLAYQSMEVAAAAQAGADYALHNGYNASGIQGAVTAATGLTVTATPAPQLATACVSGGAIVATAASTCASGGAPGSYVTVAAQATFTPILAWASFGMPSTLSAQAMVRIS